MLDVPDRSLKAPSQEFEPFAFMIVRSRQDEIFAAPRWVQGDFWTAMIRPEVKDFLMIPKRLLLIKQICP